MLMLFIAIFMILILYWRLYRSKFIKMKLTTNLHDYDKKSTDVINYILGKKLPDLDYQTIIQDISNTLLSEHRKIWNQLIQNSKSNMDEINNINTNQLIPYICMIWQNPEHRECLNIVLSEQLLDMQSGMCPPGRTLRLCQVIYVFL